MANETQITIPRPHAVFEAVMEDGAIIRLRRHGVPGAPRLVLSHGNGLAIDGYFSFWGRLLDRYERQRRTVAIEAVQQQTNRNHQIIGERDPEIRRKSLDLLRRTAANKETAREYLLNSSMISSLRRAVQIE